MPLNSSGVAGWGGGGAVVSFGPLAVALAPPAPAAPLAFAGAPVALAATAPPAEPALGPAGALTPVAGAADGGDPEAARTGAALGDFVNGSAGPFAA
jgi:hypothetical protein